MMHCFVVNFVCMMHFRYHFLFVLILFVRVVCYFQRFHVYDAFFVEFLCVMFLFISCV